MKQFLIDFTYDHYCQGWESARITLLVYATSYDEAVERIKANVDYPNAHGFTNMTML